MVNMKWETVCSNHLREWIKCRGYKVQYVALHTDIPLRTLWDYIAGKVAIPSDRREKLATFLGCSLDQLVADLKIGNDEMKRRELLYLLSIAGSTLLAPFPELDWERLEGACVHPTQLDERTLQDLAVINAHYWRLYLESSSKSSVLDGALSQIKTLIQFLREPHTSVTHQTLCTLVSDLSQLVGEIFFDRHEPIAAQSCYVFAVSAAKEAGAYDLWASALVRHAFIPIYDAPEPRYEDALPLLQHARQIVLRGNTELPTRYWVAAVEAEATSGVGDLNACQDALDRTLGVLEIKKAAPAWVRFDGLRLPALRGACYIRLAQPQLAASPLQDALQQFTKPGRKRGMVLLDLAAAAIQCQNIEQACSYTHEAVDIIELGSSGFLRQGVQKLRLRLEPFSGSSVVSKLDRRIRLFA